MTLIQPHTGPLTLLHACCGPCTLEPSRLLAADGHTLTVYYANSNIHPDGEYAKRLDTLKTWAATQDLPVSEGDYDPSNWEKTIASALRSPDCTEDDPHEARCRACYRMRFEQSAAYAHAQGYDCLSTTLSVSPYQYTDIISQELERAAKMWGLACEFRDFRPNYAEATRRSRELGMYRQNYCGCRFSDGEAKEEREERRRKRQEEKARRAQERQAWEAAHADELAQEEQRKLDKQAYAEKQARKRAILRSLRNADDASSSDASDASGATGNN
ncbi:MAG: epoxyqueuosine reductase QueH [Eggerthellaceae bacterium]|nr:epoxyqueuosine reductase QueH [Eggerthellaceae bacterium]